LKRAWLALPSAPSPSPPGPLILGAWVLAGKGVRQGGPALAPDPLHAVGAPSLGTPEATTIVVGEEGLEPPTSSV